MPEGWWLKGTTDGCCAALYVRCNNAVDALSMAVVLRLLNTLEGLKIVHGSHRHRVFGGVTFTPTTRSSRVWLASEMATIKIAHGVHPKSRQASG